MKIEAPTVGLVAFIFSAGAAIALMTLQIAGWGWFIFLAFVALVSILP